MVDLAQRVVDGLPLPLVVLHAIPTLFMAGVIWIIQVVHYPLYRRVGQDSFGDYEREHCARISWVVLPMMVLELAFASLLALAPPPGRSALAWQGLALLAVVWLSTFLIQVPCHRRLERGFDASAAKRLVATNWIRTIAWSLRAGVAVALLAG